MDSEVQLIMATTKKTTTTKKTGVSIETTPKKTTTRRKTGTTTSTTTNTKTTTSTTSEVAALREQVNTLEKKLQNLITVLHTEFSTEILQGPRGTARKLEEAGLTE